MKKNILCLSVILLLSSCNNNIISTSYNPPSSPSNISDSSSSNISDIVINTTIVDNLVFQLIDDNTYELIYTKDFSEETLVIPEIIDGIKVKSIGPSALSGLNLQELIIPSSIETIKSYALSRSTIDKLVIPDSINTIESYILFNTTVNNFEITSVPSNLKHTAFLGLTTNSITENDNGLYLGSKTNPYLILFDVKENIDNLSIVDGCEAVLYSNHYKTLNEINFSKSLKYVAPYSFVDANNLININVLENNCYFSSLDGNLYNKDLSEFVVYAPGKKSNAFTLNVKSIKEGAFSNECLENLYISNLIENVADDSFYSLKSLKNFSVESNDFYCDIDGILYTKDKKELIKVPEKISIDCFEIHQETQVLNSLFFKDTSLIKSINANNVTTVENNCFENSEIESITFTDKILYIENNAFYNCEKLTNVIIPNELIHLGDYAFSCCLSLKNIDLPNIESIANCLFEYSLVENVTIPNSVKAIGYNAFYNSAITAIDIPSSVTSIDVSAFALSRIKSISLPENLQSISNSLFYSCNLLENVILPNNLKTIESYAFSRCGKLKYLVIPASVETIEDYAFEMSDELIIFFENDKLPSNLSPNWNVGNLKYYLSNEWEYDENNIPKTL